MQLFSAVSPVAANATWPGHRIMVQSVEVPKDCVDLDLIWTKTPPGAVRATKLNCVAPLEQTKVGGNDLLDYGTQIRLTAE